MSSFVVTPTGKPLIGLARVPGDKSIGHRALLFSALADGVVTVRGLSGGADNRRTRAAIHAMGATVTDTAAGDVEVAGVGVDGLRAPAAAIDCGNSGTTMRLLCGLLAGQRFASELTGDESLSRRPMRRVAGPLAQMGGRITGRNGAVEGEIYPPLAIAAAGGPLAAIDYDSPIASAQVKSAVLLAGLYADGTTRVREPARSRDHTERMLAHMGAPLSVTADGVVELAVAGWDRTLSASHFEVPGDPSAAAFMIAAALVAGVERLAVPDVCLNPTRTGFLDVLADMGALVERESLSDKSGEAVADLVVSRGAADQLAGATLSGERVVRAIDEIPILAVVGARASGELVVRDAGELRVKESDRVATTVAMLRAFGVEVDERPDGFTVRGRAGAPLTAARIDAAGDHRIAMAATVAALAADGPVRIDDVDNVATSFPRFLDVMRSLGADIAVAP